MKSSDIIIEAFDQKTSKWLMNLGDDDHRIVREKIFNIITGEDDPAVELGSKFAMYAELSTGRYNVVFSVYLRRSTPTVRILSVREA